MKKKIRAVFLTDIHVGHPQVPSNVIRENLMRWCYPLLDSTIDILFFGGDFFHTLLDMNSRDGYFARTIIDDLIKLAKQHEFYIRVDTGTFKHDRKQLQFFLSEEEPMLDGLPLVRVFKEMTIERLPNLDLDVLYIPDSLPYNDSAERIYIALKNNHLKQVDFIVNHGYFEHLVPKGVLQPKNTLSWEKIKSIVKGCVLNGHVHTPSIYHNVIVGGSFERMNHGEEGEKGFFIIDYDHKSCKYTFVENKTACLFKTFRFEESTTLDQFIQWVKDEGLDQTQTYHLRLLGDNPGTKAEITSYIKTNYPKVVLKTEGLNAKTKENISKTTFEETELTPVTEQNLPVMVHEFIGKKLSIDRIEEIISGK